MKMDDFINREDAKKKHCEICMEECVCYRDKSRCDELKAFDSIPAADVREVKRGKWICDGYWSHGCGMGEEYGNYWKCSVCDKIVQEDYAKCGFHYCPNCGADMREEQDGR